MNKDSIRNNRLTFSRDLPIWGTIINGNGQKTSIGFQRELDKAGISYSNRGKSLLFNPDFQSSISSKKTQIDLYVMTTEEILGQKGKSRDAYAAIKNLNGCLLTAESGPNILLQLGHQFKSNEWVLVTMKPIKDSVDDIYLFEVGRNFYGRLYLNTLNYIVYPNHRSPLGRWVFSACK